MIRAEYFQKYFGNVFQISTQKNPHIFKICQIRHSGDPMEIDQKVIETEHFSNIFQFQTKNTKYFHLCEIRHSGDPMEIDQKVIQIEYFPNILKICI